VKKQTIFFIVLLVISLFFRLFLSTLAHHGDLNNNISWGQLASERGLNGFYESEDWSYSAPNQPPLSIMMFSGLYKIWKPSAGFIWNLNLKIKIFPSKWIWFWDEKGLLILIKSTAIIADLGISILLYKFLKRNGKERQAFWVALIWLINPITWYNSSVWGQSDPIVNFFGVLSLFLLLDRKLTYALPTMAISILFKGSLAVLLPGFLVISLIQKYKVKEWILSVGSSLLVVIASCIWFHPKVDILSWIFNLYQKRIFPGEIGDLTANAFNFWNIVSKGEKVLDSIKYFGLSARAWGFIIFSIISLVTLIKLAKTKFKKENAIFSLVIIGFASFLFMTRVHERYLYPIFPIMTLLLTYKKKLIPLYIALSVVFLLNMFNLWWYPTINTLFNFLTFKEGFMTIALSWVNIVIFVILCVIYFLDLKNEKTNTK